VGLYEGFLDRRLGSAEGLERASAVDDTSIWLAGF
jgi:hypothetical protein